jgi:hypothetical protein
MNEPWFAPDTFAAWFGALAGGVGGSLLGVFGGFSSLLVRRGKCRKLVLTGFLIFIGLGLLSLGFGVLALVLGQPYGIWYGPLLAGVIIVLVSSILLPLQRQRYRQVAEQRLQAEALRRS